MLRISFGSGKMGSGLISYHGKSRRKWIGEMRPDPILGFTLVEMLVAMAITLVMMGAVVVLFANISHSVRNRRATIELSAQLRHLRNVLQQDLQGATCPGITWQRPESNHGYIEIIEGPCKEGNASNLIDGIDLPNSPDFNPEIDHVASILPSSNLPFTTANPTWVTDCGGLGDADDILMLTVRNEREPFVGRAPTIGDKQTFDNWAHESLESPLAEVVWFAIENPGASEKYNTDSLANRAFYGEPAMRTIYRRTLLIAPWINPYKALDTDGNGLVKDSVTGLTFKVVPGLVRMVGNTSVEKAIAQLIAFQDRYDLSVRLEWDQNLGPSGGYKIMANTLGDLTKRENRFCHFFYRPIASGARPAGREFPFAAVSIGGGYPGTTASVNFIKDSTLGGSGAAGSANIESTRKSVISYTVTTQGSGYQAPPFVYVSAKSTTIATAQAVLNDDGQVVRVIHGPAPLWGPRRGEDVMMTDALAFDLRVYDPGAPVFATRKPIDPTASPAKPQPDLDVVITPSDPAWRGTPPNGSDGAYLSNENMLANGTGAIGTSIGVPPPSTPTAFVYAGQGAYVDMGYGFDLRYKIGSYPPGVFPPPTYAAGNNMAAAPWFFNARGLSDVYGNLLAPGYAVYDTWSFHYENNGIDEDGNGVVDQGTNGMEDVGQYANPNPPPATISATRLGIDDIGERETTPPYDKPLRGAQVIVRAYERDSRQIRQVRVSQHFMGE